MQYKHMFRIAFLDCFVKKNCSTYSIHLRGPILSAMLKNSTKNPSSYKKQRQLHESRGVQVSEEQLRQCLNF